MTRKRPVFVKEYSSDSEDCEDWDEKAIDYGGSNEEYAKSTVSIKKSKNLKANLKKENYDDDSTELEDSIDAFLDDSIELENCDEDSKDPLPEDQIVEDFNNLIVKIDKYWPYGMEIGDALPENKKLLYLYSFDLTENMEPCEFCKADFESCQEMTLIIKYSILEYPAEEACLEMMPVAFAKYIEKHDPKLSESATFEYLLKPNCCSKAKAQDIISDNGECISESLLIKYFVYKEEVHVYLKVDPKSIPAIPENIDEVINSKLKEQYYFDAIKKWQFKHPSVLSGKYADTFDFAEAKIPAGFRINLRSYQLRSISWMKEIESSTTTEANSVSYNLTNQQRADECFMKVKLGHTPFYVEFNGSKVVTRSPETMKMKSLRFYGGVLADDTGSGKTATTLGLIHSAPFNEEKRLQRYSRFHELDCYDQSRATLIICPSNIYKQWISEAKKCNPNFKIHGFSTILDHRKVSIQDVIDADIIVVSYQFLTNSNYCSFRKKSYMFFGTHYNLIKGCVNIQNFHYHRIILDEFHELAAAPGPVREYVKNISADFVWGLTGTPGNKILSELFKYSIPPQRILENEAELEYKHVKRNVPNLELPQIETETVWIDLTAHELALLQCKGREVGIKGQIMMCTHYQLNEKENVAVNEFGTIENVQKKMAAKKSREIDVLKQELLSWHGQIEAILKEKPGANISYYEGQLKTTEHKLASAQSNFNYFQNVFKVIGEPDKNECLICYDNIPTESLSILPCSHLYCIDCIKGAILKCNACPLCRYPASEKEIFRIRIKEQEEVPKALVNIDMSKYSSKLVGLYRYITDLINTDKNARIILFLQFSDLADFIGDSLKELSVEYVRVAGNVFQRQNAISKFRESENVRLIMMSSEDSVSGINLTQATHVILLHPFWTGKEATDLAYEKQGISRAYRFGLDHPLKVVRFAVRGSVEEEITLRRENINLSN